MKIPNYLGWATMIVTANKLGIEIGCLEISKNIVETLKEPSVFFSKELELQAIKANSKVLILGLMEKANKIAEELLIKYV